MIFPFIDGGAPDEEQIEIQTELPIPREYAWDFEKDTFILKDGKMVIVEGNEAIKVWAYKALKTPRYRYKAYSWDFGNEIESLIGTAYTKDAIKSEANRYIRECLLVNPYIVDVNNLVTEFEGNKLTIECTLVTIYGEVNLNV